MLVLVFFGPRGLGKYATRVLSAIRVMFFYSVLMVFAQIMFLDLAVPPNLRGLAKFNTCLERVSETMPEGNQVFCVDDPHYVTLALSILALLVLVDKNIISALAKLLKGMRPIAA